MGGVHFDLQGHRGCRGLRPENTINGFRHAMALGVTTMELDVGLTADGVPAVYHDVALNPDITRGPDGAFLAGPGPLLRSLRMADLAAYDVGRIRPGSGYAATYPDQVPEDGARIPTLGEVVALVAGAAAPVRLDIEVKVLPARPGATARFEAITQAVLATLDVLDMAGRATIRSFDWRVLDWLARHRPGISRAYLSEPETLTPLWLAGREPRGRPAWQLVAEAGGTLWSPLHQALTEAEVRGARGAGLSVVPWTVNQKAEMRRLVDWGVDGIITDFPDRLRAVLAEKKVPLPPAAA